GGLLIALGFTKDIASEIVLECLKEGLLVNPVKPNAIRFMPPLIITEKEVDEALDILKTVLNRRTENGR
ncbi:MAG: aminotransferase class III-fold pyridoxal phosphate-dependent enzyme, partial [Chloroflexi bacterium]|nr:aminotransferase class III-fold pyridoxal phosphate-dependent enzyme [Chloroflexota bacterium]MBM4451516.1 aminotransferase class III-fold pyridoxal phosphate-dependent enzyme [Chloroflexota bacterium]